ncbi:Pleckstrin-like proteiny domain-containing family J member 1 [Gryllus bimaculatus]|nr:Pleckstrin-like proteiny domain-containing family J member 1 [Gryllus bimaculatus]
MRFNDKELAEIGVGAVELEGRLNHRRPTSGNFTQSGFKERWFKLKSNLLFYFRINELGKIDYKQPAGVFVLENSNVQYEMGIGIPFAFSVTFRDEPDKKHVFSGRSESHIQQWVNAMRQATYEYWRSQLIILQTKINARTGKDPLLLLPHNAGTVRDIDTPPTKPRTVGPRSSSFQSHVQKIGSNSKGTREVKSSWTTFDDDDDGDEAVAETSFSQVKETNLIDL